MNGLTANLWEELEAATTPKDPQPTVVIRLPDGSEIVGSVLKHVEGWVKLMPCDIGDAVWVNMYNIVTWSLIGDR